MSVGAISGGVPKTILTLARGQKDISPLFKPDSLAGETKFAMAKILPARAFREGAEFAEGKCARGGEPRIGARHGIAKDEGGEKISADRGEQATAQIGDKNIPVR